MFKTFFIPYGGMSASGLRSEAVLVSSGMCCFGKSVFVTRPLVALSLAASTLLLGVALLLMQTWCAVNLDKPIDEIVTIFTTVTSSCTDTWCVMSHVVTGSVSCRSRHTERPNAKTRHRSGAESSVSLPLDQTAAAASCSGVGVGKELGVLKYGFWSGDCLHRLVQVLSGLRTHFGVVTHRNERLERDHVRNGSERPYAKSRYRSGSESSKSLLLDQAAAAANFDSDGGGLAFCWGRVW